MTAYLKRELADMVARALGQMPVVVVSGMRQVGKSTMLLHDPALRNREYIDLDDFSLLEAAKTDPEGLLSRAKFVTIDEAQRCPELFLSIKRMVDADSLPGRFLLSGSANISLLKQVTESLAGRAVYFNLSPITIRETSRNIDEEPFLIRFAKELGLPGKAKHLGPITDNQVIKGGMPQILLGDIKDRELWFRSYEQTYLERDLRDIASVDNILAFRRLLNLAAFRTAQVLNISNLAQDAGINRVTCERYIGLMNISFVTHILRPYLKSGSARLRKSPKLMMADSGITAYLTGVEDLQRSHMRGALYENYVFQNILGILEPHLIRSNIYYWQIAGRYEVDFVVEIGGETIAIEVKAATRWGDNDLSGLRAFISRYPGCKAGILAYNGREAVSLGDKMWAIPLSLLLS
jgi:predicted AAA+ superfamily ATPase